MLIYDTDVYYEVSDCYGFLGAVIVNKDSEIKFYNGEMYFDAINWVRSMLHNYNSIMASKEHLLPREIYGLKVLERTGLDKDETVLVPRRTKKTEEMVKRYSAEFDLSNHTNHNCSLTLDENEAETFAENCMLKVYIDLETNEVNLKGFAVRLDQEDYCTVKDVDPKGFDMLRKSLPPFPKFGDDDYSITRFTFNIIDDVEKAAKDNLQGFYSMRVTQVIAIR